MTGIEQYKMQFTSQKLEEQVEEFLMFYRQEKTLAHSIEVAIEAKKVAALFAVSQGKAYTAGLLHDISCVIPNQERVNFSEELHLEILPEEYQVPMLLHQKQSVLIAREVFKITDKEVLSAIEVHTTLKKEATDFEKVVFIADKIKWDRDFRPPYLVKLNSALTESLDAACKVYLKWLQKDLLVLHPWLADALLDFSL